MMALLFSKAGRYLVVAVVVVVAFVAFKQSEQRKGAAKAVAKIERATDNAISKGKRAATASASDSVRGKRDPSTRDD